MSNPKMKEMMERHMAENQVAFRHINERVPKGFEELLKLAEEENQRYLVELPTGFLYFICECSDEDCRLKVRLTLKTFQRIHKRPDRFFVAKGHDVPDIEDIVAKSREYDVVVKKKVPRQNVNHFWATPLHFV